MISEGLAILGSVSFIWFLYLLSVYLSIGAVIDRARNTMGWYVTYAVCAVIIVLPIIPVATVNQTDVLLVRSPQGNAAAEDLGGHVIPAGPHLALEPADPTSNLPGLPAATFSLSGGGTRRIPSQAPHHYTGQRSVAHAVTLGMGGAYHIAPVDHQFVEHRHQVGIARSQVIWMSCRQISNFRDATLGSKHAHPGTSHHLQALMQILKLSFNSKNLTNIG